MPSSDFVVLCDGLSVPLPALQLLWRLEQRGMAVFVQGGHLVVTPKGRLTGEDDREIRRHCDALAELVQRIEAVQ